MRPIALTLLTLLATPPFSGAAAEDTPTVRWVVRDGRHCAEAVGVEKSYLDRLARSKLDAEGWQKVFRVAVVIDGAESRPMLGTYEIKDGLVRFRPRFPLEPGLTYSAGFVGPRPLLIGEQYTVGGLITIPAAGERPASRILRVDPSLEIVPENLLKLYLTFSEPMSRGGAYRHVRLLDSRQKPLDLPFLELGEELWDPTQTRLTLLFDPGRIKRGLRPREEEGPILEAGKTYTLVIDAEWKDAAGRPLAKGVRRTFKAGPADMTSPDPRRWELHRPEAGSKAPLSIRFGEPLDRALAQRLIAVIQPNGEPVAGEVVLDDDTQGWRFNPAERWGATEYSIRVGKDLEDLAGNSVARAFEVDEFRVDRKGEQRAKDVVLTFRPLPPSAR